MSMKLPWFTQAEGQTLNLYQNLFRLKVVLELLEEHVLSAILVLPLPVPENWPENGSGTITNLTLEISDLQKKFI